MTTCCASGSCAQVDTSADAANCGTCAHACSSSEACRCGRCQALVQLAGSQDAPWNITLDSDHGVLYWTNSGTTGDDGAIMSIPVDGCGMQPSPFMATPPLDPTWIQVGIGWNHTGGIGYANHGAVASDTHAFYLTDGLTGTVSAVPFGGGALQPFATGQGIPAGIVVVGGIVYWANYMDGTLMMAPVKTLSPVTQFAGLVMGLSPWNIAVDGATGTFYWTAQNTMVHPSGAVMTMAIGGTAPTAFAELQDKPWGIAVDGSDVYWTNGDGGTVMRKSEKGGPMVTIAVKQNNPQGIVVDAQNVYWVNAGKTSNAGSIMKWAK
jgi:hypothetical protein